MNHIRIFEHHVWVSHYLDDVAKLIITSILLSMPQVIRGNFRTSICCLFVTEISKTKLSKYIRDYGGEICKDHRSVGFPVSHKRCQEIRVESGLCARLQLSWHSGQY